MDPVQPVTREYFIKRLSELLLRSGLSGFPKDGVDQHILLKSAVLALGRGGSFTEQEINQRLGAWVTEVARAKNLDRTTLRRRLVDTGYLIRSKDGSNYQAAQPEPRPGLFDESVGDLDVLEVVAAAREEIARRKRVYLEKSRGA